MRNRKLVHVISSLSRGGAEQILVSLCTKLAQQPYSYEQTVISFRDGPLRDELEKRGIVTILVRPFFFRRLYQILKTLQPDIVHSSLWSANLLMRIICAQLNVPLVCALHNLSALDGAVRTAIARIIPYHATYYCTVSDAVAQSYTYLPKSRILTIANGVQEPLIYQKTLQKDCFIIGAVGRFIPSKNYSALVHIFADIHKKYPHTRLFLVGHGPQERLLKALVEQLHLVDVTTFIINKPASPYYHLFDCFAHPSWSEGFGLSAAEAASYGIPTLITADKAQLSKQLIAHLEHPEKSVPPRATHSLSDMVSAYHTLFQLNL